MMYIGLVPRGMGRLVVRTSTTGTNLRVP
jgi:hypothetical protein